MIGRTCIGVCGGIAPGRPRRRPPGLAGQSPPSGCADSFLRRPTFAVEEAGELDWVNRIPSMHTLARPPVREARLKRQAGIRAFTLIELLTVIAIIALLAAITFGVIKGVNERAAIGQARAELASLSQALEAYKLQYGDYPRTGLGAVAPSTSTTLAATHTQALLFNALVGKLGPKLSNSTEVAASAMNGKSFVELSKFSLENANLPSTTTTAAVLNCFLDPWGRRYMYYYDSTTAGWRLPSYVLFSVGPTSTYTAPTATDGKYSDANNLDNIYANRN